MKKLLLLLCFVSSMLLSVNAQISFRTGDSELDGNLKEINLNANVDIKAFNSDLKLSFNVSDKKLEYMKTRLKMAPAEMYLALEISKVSRKPIGDVLKSYKSNRGQGWGYIAKQAGIRPGSSEFMQLKSNSKERKRKGKSKGYSKKVGGSSTMNNGHGKSHHNYKEKGNNHY